MGNGHQHRPCVVDHYEVVAVQEAGPKPDDKRWGAPTIEHEEKCQDLSTGQHGDLPGSPLRMEQWKEASLRLLPEFRYHWEQGQCRLCRGRTYISHSRYDCLPPERQHNEGDTRPMILGITMPNGAMYFT